MPVPFAPSLLRAAPYRDTPRANSGWLRLYRDLANYLIFGGIAAIANLAVGWLLYHEFTEQQLPYWAATTIAASCGLLVNFLLNYTYFGFSERSALRQFGTFVIVASLGVALTGALSQALLGLAQILLNHADILATHVVPKFAAHITAVGLVFLYSFPAHRMLSFNVGVLARIRQLLRRGVK